MKPPSDLTNPCSITIGSFNLFNSDNDVSLCNVGLTDVTQGMLILMEPPNELYR